MAKRVLGVLGGADMSPDMLRKWAQSAEILLAADSGADRLIEAGATPDIIIGDMDSCSPKARDSGARLYKMQGLQETTDCDKLLAYALDQSLLPITLAGIEGDRLDHTIAAIHSASRSEFLGHVKFALRKGLAWVLGPGEHKREFHGKRTISLLPLVPSHGISTVGLKWQPQPELKPDGFTSISNECPDGKFEVQIESGLIFMVVSFSQEELPIW